MKIKNPSYSQAEGRHKWFAGDGSFTMLDYPGASATFVTGINSEGAVIGVYGDASGGRHSFLWTRGASD